jgi:hypothetical protein
MLLEKEFLVWVGIIIAAAAFNCRGAWPVGNQIFWGSSRCKNLVQHSPYTKHQKVNERKWSQRILQAASGSKWEKVDS